MAVSAKSFIDAGVTLTPAQERDFFKSIRLANRVFKTTEDRRMDDLNALLVSTLKEAGAKPREILDVGASSGITSVELIDSLVAAGFKPQLVASDVSLFGNLVQLSARHYVLTDQSGEILQHVVLGQPLRPWPRRLDMFTGYWLIRRLANWAARGALAKQASGDRVMLVSDRARAHPRMSFVEDDILSDPPGSIAGRFDLVRAANVLNRNYFDEADLGRAVAGILRRMRGPGSILVVARTLEDRSNHGTIFRLSESGFEVLSRLGNGSEIEEIVLGCADLRRGRRI